MSALQRFIAVAVVAALIGLGVAVDRYIARPEAVVGSEAAPDKGAVAAPAGVVSSSWFCPGGALTPDGANADVTVMLANPGVEPVWAEVTAMGIASSGGATPDRPESSRTANRRVEVPGKGSVPVKLGDLLGGTAAAGASVVVEGGGVVAGQTLKTPEGVAASSCASQGAEHWYSATGSTGPDTSMVLNLFNPFPEDAIVNVGFLTEQGGAKPGETQGIVVPGRTLKLLDVTDKVRRREWVATTVTTNAGRLVASRTLRKTPSTSFAVMAPELSSRWGLPVATRQEGGKERVVVYNPGARPTEATLEFQGTGDKPIPPVKVDVPENGRAEVDLNEIVPKGRNVAVSVSTSDEVGVVVERSSDVVSKGTTGHYDELGLPVQASRWIAPAAPAKGTDTVNVVNYGKNEVRPRILLLDGKRQALRFDVPPLAPGDQASIKLDEKAIKGGPLLIEADDVLLVNRVTTDGATVSASPAVALG